MSSLIQQSGFVPADPWEMCGEAVAEPKPELRILHVFSALGMGGAETWLMSLLRYFRENENDLPFKIQNDVLLTSGESGHFDREAKELGARLFYVTYSRSTLFSFVRQFRRILKERHYDVIHDHQDYTAGWHFLMGAGRLPPIRLTHVHNTYSSVEERSTGLVRRLTCEAGKRLLSTSATHISGTSQQIIERYGLTHKSFAHVERRVVRCGFDVARFNGLYADSHAAVCKEFGWDKSVKILLFAGRLDSISKGGRNQKNPRFALEVARDAIARNSGIRMVMAGGGQNQHELALLVKEWGLTNEIRLVGIRDDLSRLMLASDLLVFPSFEEGLGMVAVEAQASGLRVLASNHVSAECVVLPQLVSFSSLDLGPTGWAQKVLHLLSLSKPDAEACNSAVRESAFSVDQSARALLDVYANGIPR